MIVGGGPAAFVPAEQLSEDINVSVSLLEAGIDGSDNEDIYTPGFAGLNEYSPRIWNYYVTLQKQLGGFTPHLAQCKLYGGGTAVNYTNCNRGASSVFDEWAEMSGNAALRWDNLFNDFKATVDLENNTIVSHLTQPIDFNAYGDGLVTVARTLTINGFDPYWNEALQSTLNLPLVDFNSGVGK